MPGLTQPRNKDDITVEWLDAALRANGHLKGGHVVDVDVVDVGVGRGYISQTVRITPTYDDPAAGPASLVAKVPTFVQLPEFTRPWVTVITGAEVDWYLIASAECPIRVPQVYSGGWDSRHAYHVLMEDFDLGTLEQVDACPTPQARKIVETLGQLHASWWNDDRLNSDWIPSVATHTALHQPFVEDGWDLFASQIVPQINPDFAPIGERLVRDFPSLYARGAESASTLIHGDYRLSNFLFGQVGSAEEIVVLDWQLIGAGSGPRDLAYFLSQNLDIEQRRETEEELVKLYHETLVSNGVEGYSFDQCWEDYLLGLLASMYIPLLGTRFQDVLEPPADDAPAAEWEIHRTYVETGLATIRAMGERNISAIMDSGAADLLAP